MNRRSPLRLPTLLFALLAPFALAACGNKGPLVLPDQPAQTTVEAPAEATAPPADQQADQKTGDQADGQSEQKADTPPPPPARER